MSSNQKTLLRIVLSAVGLTVSIFVAANHSLPWYWELLPFLLVYALIGWDIVWEALQGIGRGQIFDENFLMVLATAGAFATGEYPEAVSVMLLYQVGELFQRYAVGKSRGSISELMNLRSDTACVLRDGAEQEIPPEEVRIGEVCLVRPGERVPLDGVVLQGESLLDTSALTGESVPRHCRSGEEILSGVIVLDGTLTIRAEKLYEDSTVARILDMVENVSGKKARAERFITRFSRWYTPVVVMLALMLAAIPPLFDGQWSVWIRRSLNFLVVSCPCALVISVPMTVFCGIGAASRAGILVKGGSYLEQLEKASIFLFDKTGTLTKGKFEVSAVVPEDRKEEILSAAAVAEHGSRHPIASAIVRAAPQVKTEGWSVREYAGNGVLAQRDAETILAGNQRMMAEYGVHVQSVQTMGSLVYVARNGQYLGAILVEDSLKPDTKQAIESLHKMGAVTGMLTGDRVETARNIAERLGIPHCAANLLPEDKVITVEQILAKKESGKVLVYVGDGINDAPVLMRADVGIAMGNVGSDAAMEAADVVLMHDKLSALPVACSIARKTMKIVRQNILFALSIKLLVLALTPFGLVSIWLAIFADVGVAILAVLNAMRASKCN